DSTACTSSGSARMSVPAGAIQLEPRQRNRLAPRYTIANFKSEVIIAGVGGERTPRSRTTRISTPARDGWRTKVGRTKVGSVIAIQDRQPAAAWQERVLETPAHPVRLCNSKESCPEVSASNVIPANAVPAIGIRSTETDPDHHD